MGAPILTFTEFGYPWVAREGDLGAGSPWSAGGVTRYSESSGPFSGRRRIGLSASSFSCGLKLDRVLGLGTYTVYLSGRLEAFDPSIVAAAWLYDDAAGRNGGVEVDFEYTAWRDVNNPDRCHLGVINNWVRFGDVARTPARPFRWWMIRLTQLPTVSRVSVSGYRESDARWIETSAAEWKIPASIGATLRVGIWKNGPLLYPASQSVAPKIVVAGVEFAP